MNVELWVDSNYKPFQILRKESPRYVLLASEKCDTASINCCLNDLIILRDLIDKIIKEKAET